MSLSSKFFSQFNGEKIVNICQYLTKMWKKVQ